MHWQNPRKATERSVLLTCSSNGVIDFRYMGSYVRYPIIIKSINPYTRVTFNHVSIYIMKSSTRVLEGGGEGGVVEKKTEKDDGACAVQKSQK